VCSLQDLLNLLCIAGVTAALLLQILARALGGSVGPNPDGNFVLTIEQIQPTQQLQQFSQLHTAVQQALAAAADRGGSSSVATAEASGCSADADASQLQAAAAAAAEEVNDADAGAVADALESMSIASSANNNSSSNRNNNAISDSDAAAAAAAGSRAAVVASDGGCFRLIESHGDQVGVSMWISYCYVTPLC
jgi:hypothetical protein